MGWGGLRSGGRGTKEWGRGTVGGTLRSGGNLRKGETDKEKGGRKKKPDGV